MLAFNQRLPNFHVLWKAACRRCETAAGGLRGRHVWEGTWLPRGARREGVHDREERVERDDVDVVERGVGVRGVGAGRGRGCGGGEGFRGEEHCEVFQEVGTLHAAVQVDVRRVRKTGLLAKVCGGGIAWTAQ